MSRLLNQVAGLFVAPEAAVGVVAAVDAPPASEAGRGTREVEWRPPLASQSPASSTSRAPGGEDGVSEPRPGGEPRPPVDAAAVIGTGGEAVALAAALAGELRVRNRARTALVLVWQGTGAAPAPMPAWPAARHLAATLAEAHDVAARGWLVHLQLPHQAATAVAEASRLTAAARVPTVLALCGARSPSFDSLLRSRGLLVVSEPVGIPDSLAGLAAAQLSLLNARVLIEPAIRGIGRRRLAAWGLGRARWLGLRGGEALP